MTRGPNPTLKNGSMFTYVPAQDELSSNVIGLGVYNEDKQNIGTIKDIALDANGLNGYIVNVGRFLGMGDHYVVVRPSAISLKAEDDKWHAKMNVNADQLKTAPEYKYPANLINPSSCWAFRGRQSGLGPTLGHRRRFKHRRVSIQCTALATLLKFNFSVLEQCYLPGPWSTLMQKLGRP